MSEPYILSFAVGCPGICGLAAGLRFVRRQTPQRLLAHESAGTLETGTVRFSLSAFNTEREILEIAKHIRSCLK